MTERRARPQPPHRAPPTTGGGRLLHAALCVSLAGCTASSEEVSPPRYDPYYPTALAISADERYLFVLNANSDLRYDSGTLQVLDLEALEALTARWEAAVAGGGEPAPPADAGCEREVLFPMVASCPTTLEGGDPAAFVVPGGAVKVGNFGTSIGLQPLERADGTPSGVLRAFAAVRGDPSLSYADFDPATGLTACGGAGDYPRCAETHRLDEYRNDPELGTIPEEPYGLAVDPIGEHVYMTHLTTGSVTLATAPATGGEPLLVDRLAGLFASNALNGLVRAAAVAPRLPGDPGGWVYVTSTSEARIALVHVAESSGGPDEDALAAGPSFYFGEDVADGLPGDSRGIVFSSDGERGYVVSRSPPALYTFDTSIDAAGAPRNELVSAVEICAQGAGIALAEGAAGRRVYLPCFSTGQLWVVDADRAVVEDVSDVGRGPQAVAVAPGRGRAYVANYAEDTIAVIDIRPDRVTRNHPVLRVGKPRQGSLE